MELMEPVDELKFEVSTDVHGTAEGPRLGRQRVINKVRVFAIAMYSSSYLIFYIVTAYNISIMLC